MKYKFGTSQYERDQIDRARRTRNSMLAILFIIVASSAILVLLDTLK